MGFFTPNLLLLVSEGKPDQPDGKKSVMSTTNLTSLPDDIFDIKANLIAS